MEQFTVMIGDLEPLDFLRAVVGVEPIDESTARGRTDFGVVERGGLFGGQMVSQALASCAHTVAPGSVPDSIHANLLGGGASGEPIEFRVDRVRDGAALQHRDVRGYQAGRIIVHAAVVSAIPVEGADWQAGARPPVGSAERWARRLPGRGPATSGGVRSRWCTPRATRRGSIPGIRSGCASVTEVPDDPWLHGAVVAFWSDYGMNGATRATHEEVAGPTSSVSATHSVWIHRRSRPRDWHLLDVAVGSLSGNQGFVQRLAPRLFGSTRGIDIAGGVHPEATTMIVGLPSRRSAVAADHLLRVALQCLYPRRAAAHRDVDQDLGHPGSVHLREPFQVRIEVASGLRPATRAAQLLDLYRDRRGVASGCGHPALHVHDGLGQAGGVGDGSGTGGSGADVVGDDRSPTFAVVRDPLAGTPAVASDPDRRVWALHRTWPLQDPLRVEARSAQADRLAGPQLFPHIYRGVEEGRCGRRRSYRERSLRSEGIRYRPAR